MGSTASFVLPGSPFAWPFQLASSVPIFGRFQTVAEGIESAESAVLLRDLGSDVLQGYFLSPPLPSADVLGVLEPGARPTF